MSNDMKKEFETFLASEKTHSEPFVTLAEYYEMLEKHDWYHMMSDDRGVDDRGAQNYRKLEKIAQGDPMKKQLMLEYQNHMFTGEPWRTPKAPKPVRPL
jgi:hypothetical protein